MLENLRFEPGETENDPAFATNLCELADVYVNEAFGASHRAHASIVGPPPLLPSAGGRLLFREVEMLSRLLDEPGRPFVAVLGRREGERQARCDRRAPRALRHHPRRRGDGVHLPASRRAATVGDSLVEPDMVGECKRLLDTGRVRIPVDVVIAA